MEDVKLKKAGYCCDVFRSRDLYSEFTNHESCPQQGVTVNDFDEPVFLVCLDASMPTASPTANPTSKLARAKQYVSINTPDEPNLHMHYPEVCVLQQIRQQICKSMTDCRHRYA